MSGFIQGNLVLQLRGISWHIVALRLHGSSDQGTGRRKERSPSPDDGEVLRCAEFSVATDPGIEDSSMVGRSEQL